MENSSQVPDKILDGLYLAGANVARNHMALRKRGITHVLTVADIPPPWPDKFKYRQISVADESQTDLLSRFEEAHQFIDEARGAGGAILVHCAAGVSRSATIVISYVMREDGKTYEEAFDFVKEKRSVVCPNRGFVEQLQKWEQTLAQQEKKK